MSELSHVDEATGDVRMVDVGGKPLSRRRAVARGRVVMALHAGRRARLETAIGESPASVPAAAAALAQQVFEGLDGRRVVLVGAGRTSELTARNLRSRGAMVTAVVNRTLDHAERLAAELGARALPLDDAAQAVTDADVVVSSTSAPGFVLAGEQLVSALRSRRGRPVLFVDLAVPRDVDPALASVDGCFVYDVDDLEAVVSASLEGRRAEAVQAERIVAAEAERFRAWQASLAVVPAIASLRALAEEIRSSELARVEGKLPESQRAMVDTVTAQIVNKLLHLPTIRMPWTFPLGLEVGVLRSPCASIQMTPPGRPAAARRPASVPSAIEWSPPSTSGIAPLAAISSTIAARPAQASRISGRKRACSSSTASASGSGVRTFPRSTTEHPNDAIRSSRPA